MRLVYLDNNASTPLDKRVLEVLHETSERFYANPASDHLAGKMASELAQKARQLVAQLVGSSPDEIYFTSGATESLNLAILGLIPRERASQSHVITSAIEHAAVFKCIEHLKQKHGLQVTVLRPDRAGRIHATQVQDSLQENTVAVVLLHGNNEIGAMNDLAAIGSALGQHPARFVVDAAQTCGYYPPQVADFRIDLMCISSHKMHGPKGVGALYCRRGVRLEPVIFGGEQEQGLRSGTLPVPLVAAFGMAAEITSLEKRERVAKVIALRDRFLSILSADLPEIRVNGDLQCRLPGNLSLTFPWIEAAHLQARLPHIAFSRGSACSTATGHLSHVLQAIGLSHEEMHWTVRVGFSCMNTTEEIDFAAAEFVAAARELMGG